MLNQYNILIRKGYTRSKKFKKTIDWVLHLTAMIWVYKEKFSC